MRRIALAAGCLLFTAAGCSSSPASPAPTATAASATASAETIVIQNFAFHPASLSAHEDAMPMAADPAAGSCAGTIRPYRGPVKRSTVMSELH